MGCFICGKYPCKSLHGKFYCRKHEERLAECEDCGEWFVRPWKLGIPVCSSCQAKRCSSPSEFTCEYCGKKFTAPPRSVPSYCSKECRGSAMREANKHREKEKAVCENCGKTYSREMGRQRYCSPECGAASRAVGRYKIFERDDFKCFYCGRSSYEDGAVFHVDHIIPRNSGGEDTAENLVTCCSECNLSKLAMPIRNICPIQKEVEKRNERAGLFPKTLIKIS